MAKQDQFLTTGEFAAKAGLPTSSVTKLIRDGKIKAEKKSGKWRISPDQLTSKAVQGSPKPGKKAQKTAAAKTAKSAGKKKTVNKPAPDPRDKPAKAKAEKMYSVAEFADMTYLTEFGVKEWLKQGRLTGRQAAGGEWQVDPASLESPDVKRLLR